MTRGEYRKGDQGNKTPWLVAEGAEHATQHVYIGTREGTIRGTTENLPVIFLEFKCTETDRVRTWGVLGTEIPDRAWARVHYGVAA